MRQSTFTETRIVSILKEADAGRLDGEAHNSHMERWPFLEGSALKFPQLTLGMKNSNGETRRFNQHRRNICQGGYHPSTNQLNK